MDQVVAVAVERCARRGAAERGPEGHAPAPLPPTDVAASVAKANDRALDDEQSFEDLLAELLEPVVEASPIVDTAGILLHEEDPLHRAGRLRVAASIGLEDEECRWYTIPVGTGFSGTVAATRAPLLLNDATHSPLVVSEWVHRRGIRAIYGVPIVSNDELLGVAHMGSLVATDFPEREKHGLEVAAERAASARYKRLHG
jgi:GAF domain-containing protein